MRNAGTLLAGNGGAQAIAILFSPILTRIYAPEHLGTFVIFQGMAGTLAILATGRYCAAILLPSENVSASHVAAAAFVISGAVSLILVPLAWIGRDSIPAILGNPELSAWLIYLPLLVALLAVAQVCTSWLTRQKQFGSIASNALVRSTSTVGLQTGSGLVHPAAGGLIGGILVANALATLLLVRKVWRSGREWWSEIYFEGLKTALIRYRRFPLLDLPSALFGSLATYMPVFLISVYFGSLALGLYALTHRVMVVPIAFFAKAIVGAFYQRAADDFNKTASCRPIFLKCFALLTLLGMVPFLIVVLFGPNLFALIFGESWRTAGEYARILAPMFLLKFIASPLGFVFYIREKQGINLVWQVGAFIGAAASLIVGGQLNDVNLAIILFSLSYSIGYLIHLGISFRLSKGLLGSELP